MDFLKPYLKKYFENIDKKVKEYYKFAEKVRSLGYDPEPFVEMPPAEDLAARVEGLVGPKGIANFIRELEEKYGENTDKIIMEVIDAILDEKFGNFDGNIEKKIEQALRTAAAIETNAVVSAPIEGIAYVKIKQNKDGSKYLAVYFAGPIRGAGGTAAAKIVVFADYIRKKVGLKRYKPTEDQIRRYLEERELVHNLLARLQYYPNDEEMRTIVENCPVEVNGEPTGDKEVEVTKNIEGVETNKLRQSVHLVLCEGIALKAPKVIDAAEKYGLDWSWLNKLINKESDDKKEENKEKEINIWEKIKPNDKYLQEIAGGRAILAYPSKIGGFRIRYGKSRNNGIMAKNIHPCAMILSDEFIAIGTQLKVERSGKAMAAVPCDRIEAPVVKLKNGDVIRVDDIDLAKRLMENDEIERILFLGDVLITFGDFKKKKDTIAPAGYCEEWWKVELEEKYGLKIDDPFNVSLEEALYYSKELKVPLHPKYLPFFDNLNINELKELSKFVRSGKLDGNILILDKKVKPILEKAFILHKYRDSKCYVDYGIILYEIFKNDNENIEEKDVIKYLNLISPFPIKPKAGTYMGARMGRPEKAKERMMKPPVHGLFPIGKYGGKTRYILKAAKDAEIVDVEIKYMFCEKCNKIVPAYKCPYCGSRTKKVNICPKCGNKTQREICENCGTKTETYGKQYINLKDLLKTIYNMRIPEKTKGVEGLFNKDKFFEPIEKVVLRAKHSIYVFRDGTVRFDAIDIPLTHFKPKEIGVSIEKLKELGYEVDVFGKPLENEDQILLLYPQDIIIPYHAAEYMLKISKFIDDLLEEYYGLERFYKFETIYDLVGELVIALAPHTSSGIVGRIIGFTEANGIYAHPFFHASKRRNCFPGDTRILVDIDGKIERITLKELFEMFEAEKYENGAFVRLKPKNNINVYSFDTINKKVVLTNINEVIKIPSPSHLIKISLESNRSFITTPNHPVIVYENGKFIKKLAMEIKENDLILIPKIEFEEKDIYEIDLLEEFSKEEFKDLWNILRVKGVKKWIKEKINKKIIKDLNLNIYLKLDSIPLDKLLILLKLSNLTINDVPKNCYLGIRRNKIKIKRFLNIEQLLKLIGYYLAEGTSRKTKNYYQISFSAREKKQKENIKNAIIKTFGNIKIYEKSEKLIISSKIVYLLFTKILKIGKNEKTKRVPSFVFKLPKEKIKLLLSAYFDGDGTAIAPKVTAYSVNKYLLEDIDLLLNLFGIKTTWNIDKDTNFKTRSKQKIYSLNITNYKKFFEKDCNVKKDVSKTEFGWFLRVNKTEIIKTSEKYVYSLNANKYHNVIINENILTHQCDGDEDTIMLLLDGLINFSKKYLPNSRGGFMDASLVLRTVLKVEEADDECWEMETCEGKPFYVYPLKFYEKTWEGLDPKQFKKEVGLTIVEDVLKDGLKPYLIGFTHDLTNINDGTHISLYKKLKTMLEKVERSLKLAEKINAVDVKDAAEKIINLHFIRDLYGNLKSFGTQRFRCVNCNETYRRVPLIGKCPKCGGKLVLTVTKGGIVKYLEVSQKMVEKYQLSQYIKQRLKIFEKDVNTIFKDEKDTGQKTLADFFKI